MDERTDLAERVQRLEEEVAAARATIASKDEELRDVRSQCELAVEKAQREAAGKVSAVELQLESERTQAELTRLRALEALRVEHHAAVQREKDAMDSERTRLSAWVQDVCDGCERDKKRLEERIALLEREREAPPRTSTERLADPAADPPPASSRVTESGGPPTTSHEATSDVVTTMTTFLQAQADAIAAHTRATAAQHLPALPSYTGEGKQAVDDGFDRWLERFNEKASVIGWADEHKLYQLKVHLDQTAKDVFRLIPAEEKETFDKAVAALGKRFCPRDIEELRGIEFYRVMQSDESIEQLGISVQRLGRRAFPSMDPKEFDRLIKGRFFQALLVKWQRKLEAPKPGETFHELYNRARMIEQYEKQYAASAAAHSEQSSKKIDRTKRPPTTTPTSGERIAAPIRWGTTQDTTWCVLLELSPGWPA